MTADQILRLRWLLSALLIAGAALFAVGIAIERGSEDHHDEVESSEEHSESEESEEERVLGIDVESPLLVTLGLAASLGLAVVAWRTRARAVLLVIAAFATLFTVFDVAELLHQLDESRTGLAVYVAVVALVHAAAAVVAVQRSRVSTTT